eukprot:scaffold6552_cov26-Tisochrysis_lutea.AAC.3
MGASAGASAKSGRANVVGDERVGGLRSLSGCLFHKGVDEGGNPASIAGRAERPCLHTQARGAFPRKNVGSRAPVKPLPAPKASGDGAPCPKQLGVDGVQLQDLPASGRTSTLSSSTRLAAIRVSYAKRAAARCESVRPSSAYE